MLKQSINVFSILVWLGCFANSSLAFAHTATIMISGENQYKAIRLTPQIYNTADSALADLLIKDSHAETVPYFINTGSISTYSTRQTNQMTLINAYLKNDNFYFDYKLAVTQESDVLSSSIEFITKDRNFVKTVDIYGSYDDIHWEYIQTDKIYSVDMTSKLFINFKRPQKFTHYRFRLANNIELIEFEAVNLIYHIEINTEISFIESLEPTFRVENDDKKTHIIIEGLKNLRLCDITIHTDSMFKRIIRSENGRNKEIYNLSLNGTSYDDTTIPLYWHISKGDTYTLTITNDDDKPININKITARYYADEIIFEGRPNEVYTLEFGSYPVKAAPVYDIARYKSIILAGAIDRLAIGNVHYSEIDDTGKIIPVGNNYYELIFNIVIIAITLLLGTVILLKIKK